MPAVMGWYMVHLLGCEKNKKADVHSIDPLDMNVVLSEPPYYLFRWELIRSINTPPYDQPYQFFRLPILLIVSAARLNDIRTKQTRLKAGMVASITSNLL